MLAMLAFGPLVLTDMAITLFAVLTMWAFASMWQSPSRGTVPRFGLAFGGALLSKFSAGILFFCFAAFILSLRWRPGPEQPTDKKELRAWRRTRWWCLTQRHLLRVTDHVWRIFLSSRGMSQPIPYPSLGTMRWHCAFRRLLMPPWIFLRGLALFALTGKPHTFILGHVYPHGVWYYFPLLVLLKSDPGFPSFTSSRAAYQPRC